METGFQYNDGGRKKAGFKGLTGDCVTRSISIATGMPYESVYSALNFLAKDERIKKGAHRSNSRAGVHRKTYEKYLRALGWKWVPTMQIGSGCKVHLIADELPSGKIICRLSGHLTCVIDGVIHDTFDPRREIHSCRPNDGTLKLGEWINHANNLICSIQRRCVYGYFIKE